jgi:nucleotide-binding universal stress UspA family protein
MRPGRLIMEKLTHILGVVDRAEEGGVVLDKAVALARRFRARVELMVTDKVLMRPLATLCSEMRYDEVTLSSVHRAGEPMHETILRHVFNARPDLVIKTAASAHPLRHLILVENDWQLANECPAPVLLVRHRKWATPTRFAAAVEVDDVDATRLARRILHTAGFLALGCRGNLDILYSEPEQHDEHVRMERAALVTQLVREFNVGCERIQMFEGAPEITLPPLAAARQYDVLVLGTDPDESVVSQIRGDLASRMIEAADSDIVLVRGVSCAAAQAGESETSIRQQRLDEVEQVV